MGESWMGVDGWEMGERDRREMDGRVERWMGDGWRVERWMGELRDGWRVER